MNTQADVEVLPILVIIGLFWWMICSIWNEIQSSQSKKHGDHQSALPYGAMMSVAASDGAVMEPIASAPPATAETADGLAAIRAIDEMFDIDAFLRNSKLAYETIVLAFAGGDRGILQQLLSAEVYAVFDEVMRGREDRGEHQDCKIVCVENTDIDRVAVAGQRAEITVNFSGLFVTATRDANGAVVAGNPRGITTMSDAWTFARDLSSVQSGWMLIATDTP
jgi:predicted lipid-binding transport protein (Tim44 family)